MNSALSCNVVLLAYFYPPHTEVGAARPDRFVRQLRLRGTTVHPICSSEATRLDAVPEPRAPMENAPAQRVPGPQAGMTARGAALLLRGVQRLLPCNDRLSWLPHAYLAARARLTPRSVVLSTHPPVVTHLTALALKWRHGTPWVADFRDPLWGNPTRLGRRARCIDPLIERLVLRTADAIVANTTASASVLRRRHPTHAHKVHTIWNGFDPADAIEPIAPEPGRIVITHTGTLYGDRTPLPLLRSLARLFDRHALAPDKVQVRQIGRCEPGCLDLDSPALSRLATHGCLHRSEGHLSHQLARQEMLAAHVLLLLDLNHTRPGLQVPAKTFEYVRAGRPIIALTAPGSSTAHVLDVAGVPHLCVDESIPSDRFDSLVLEFLQRRHPSVPPSAEFNHVFSAAEQTAALAAIIETVGLGRANPDYATCPAQDNRAKRLHAQPAA